MQMARYATKLVCEVNRADARCSDSDAETIFQVQQRSAGKFLIRYIIQSKMQWLNKPYAPFIADCSLVICVIRRNTRSNRHSGLRHTTNKRSNLQLRPVRHLPSNPARAPSSRATTSTRHRTPDQRPVRRRRQGRRGVRHVHHRRIRLLFPDCDGGRGIQAKEIPPRRHGRRIKRGRCG
jgi:hypothetical protein